MKEPKPFVAKNPSTGVETVVDIPPATYTSVHDWKPITPERFVQLLHGYGELDRNLSDYNEGLMPVKGLRLDPRTSALIHYTRKSPGGAISWPVLMTMGVANSPRVVCFASTQYGDEAEPTPYPGRPGVEPANRAGLPR